MSCPGTPPLRPSSPPGSRVRAGGDDSRLSRDDNRLPGEDLLEAIRSCGFGGPIESLHGGLVNLVWRVYTGPMATSESAVLKWAPPYVAAVPSMPLDDERILFGARALAALGAGGRLSAVPRPDVRPPRLLATFEQQRALLLEDLGDTPDLATWARETHPGGKRALETGRMLGGFIARLHRQSAGDAVLAAEFDNRDVQRSRLVNQYAAVSRYAERAGIVDAAELGRHAVAFGELLQGPGLCLVMGDLWPPSVLVGADAGLRVIDWEFAAYGRPSQDVAHLAAHLWMHAHRTPDATTASTFSALLQGFQEAYRATLGSVRDALFGDAGRAECAVHFGAEILTRTVGAFQSGYLYDGLEVDDQAIQEAVAVAATHLREPDWGSVFAAL